MANETVTNETAAPAATEGAPVEGQAAATDTPKGPETREQRRERLREAARLMREARGQGGAPAPAAGGSPAASDPGADPAAAAGTPPPAQPAKLDAWAKLAKAQRDLELAQQNLKREREALTGEADSRKGDLELATKYRPLSDLVAKQDDVAVMQMVYGDGWREAWLRLTSNMNPEPPKPLTAEEARALARQEFEGLQKTESEKRTTQEKERVEHGLTRYRERLVELVEANKAGYPSVQARMSMDNRDRLRKVLTEEYTKTGALPDPQVVLDRLEAEDRAYFLQALPYAATAGAQATPASGPPRTVTPALKQGGTPPAVSGRPMSIDQRREAVKERLRLQAQQQRQPQ